MHHVMTNTFINAILKNHSAQISMIASFLVPRALVSFGQRLKRGALVTLPSGYHKIYDIR